MACYAGFQLRSDGVGPRRVLHVYRAADGCLAAAVHIDLASARHSHVVDALQQLAVLVDPALDNLNTFEVRADGVLQRGGNERGRFALRRYNTVTMRRCTRIFLYTRYTSPVG
jgi:hypothetical protein